MMLALFGLPGYVEILIVVGLFMLLFGSTRLPSLMRSMGRSVNEFKAGLGDKPASLETEEPAVDKEK